jgi:hypothetical protein
MAQPNILLGRDLDITAVDTALNLTGVRAVHSAANAARSKKSTSERAMRA